MPAPRRRAQVDKFYSRAPRDPLRFPSRFSIPSGCIDRLRRCTVRRRLTMHILAIPLEILQKILHYSILPHGARRALRLKLVCSEPEVSLQRPGWSAFLTPLQNRFTPLLDLHCLTPGCWTTLHGPGPSEAVIPGPIPVPMSSGMATWSSGPVTRAMSRRRASQR